MAAGTTVYWAVSGTSITATDFSAGALSGSGKLDASGKLVFSHTLANDRTTEGDEQLRIQLFSDAARTKPLGNTATVTIKDTSTAAAPAAVVAPAALPTYTISPSATTINEGGSLITTVSTTNVKAGTVIYWAIDTAALGSVDGADLAVGTISGQATVAADGRIVINHTLANDLKLEGDEQLLVKLYSDRPGGTLLASGPAVVVKDTSVPITVTTERYQPAFTPFAITKWASAVPVPSIKQPEAIADGTGPWGSTPAPTAGPGGAVGRYQTVDPNQVKYGGIADEFFNRTIPAHNGKPATPYFSNGQPVRWFSQRESASLQEVVNGADNKILTEIYGYDGTFPGTTFKTRVGQPVVVRHWNDLPQYPGLPAPLIQREGVHLHGGHNPAHTDGYPSFVINPGMYRDYYYANTVPMDANGNPDMTEAPSTMWYHDHGEDITDLNVIKGLAGFWLSFDDTELNLIRNKVLPGWSGLDQNGSPVAWDEETFLRTSSNYDIPLALSDRRFNADGSFFYDGWPVGSNTDGYLGDVMLVNGKAYPYLKVEPTKTRLRMLGGSTARIWRLSIQDEQGVIQDHLRIGNDTWLNQQAISMKEFTISPAQRADVVMDFSKYTPGTVLYLVNTADQTSGRGPNGKLDTLGQNGFSERIMKIVVGEKTAATPTFSVDAGTPLRDHVPIQPSEISQTRTFEFGRSNGMWMINQTAFSAHRSDNPMPLGVAEQWTLINGSGGWWHPIHIHLESHQLQDINGVKPSPTYLPEKQWKSDTTLLGPNTTANVYMKFRTFTGPFVFHCHNLNHEDQMMMFNFDPNLDGLNYKAGDPIPHNRDHTPALMPHLGQPEITPALGPAPAAAAALHGHQHQHNAAQDAPPADLAPAQLAAFASSRWGSSNGDRLTAAKQDTYLNGRDGNDQLIGGDGHDMLVGGDGDDVITGNNGHDLIAGEIGNDRLTGGKGKDGFFFISGDPGHTDVITDFDGRRDSISLTHALVNSNGAENADWTYIDSRHFSGRTGEVRFAGGLLQCDLNGDRQSDIDVRLLGVSRFDQSWLHQQHNHV